jgi:outer membrane protein TolC
VASVPEFVGATLLKRPEVQAAHLKVEAASRRGRAFRPQPSPETDASAWLELHTRGLNHLLRSGADIGQASVWTPVRQGRTATQMREAEAELEAAMAAYRRALREASRDVAEAMTERRALQSRIDQAAAAVTRAEGARETAHRRHAAGLAAKADLQSAENAVIACRRGLAALEARSLGLDAAIVRALGGAPP